MMRVIVFFLYVISFLISLGIVAVVPGEAWAVLSDWQKVLFAYYVLLGFCGVLMAYWVCVDEDSIRKLYWKIEKIEKREESI